jgi:hypothetical protein
VPSSTIESFEMRAPTEVPGIRSESWRFKVVTSGPTTTSITAISRFDRS